MTTIALLICTLLLATAGTAALRQYALRRNVIDVPNARSSHTVPTPRGGGVAIVLAFLAAVLAMPSLGLLEWREAIAYVGAGAAVAVVGFVDDHRAVAARWRLLVHFGAAAWCLFWLGTPAGLTVAGLTLPDGVVLHGLLLLGIVWSLNLFNFMDGIDGLAGVEATTVCLGGAVVALAQHGATSSWIVPAALAAATLGFLCWNFPPARIFMGDAGSGFLGLLLAALAVQASHRTGDTLWCWLILYGVFCVDATVTLVRRIASGKHPSEAHRSHAYQQASRRLGAHRPVTLGVLAINVGWLLPMAMLVATGRMTGSLGLVIAYLPLVLLALRFKAGRDE